MAHKLFTAIQVATTEAWIPEEVLLEQWLQQIISSRLSADTEISVRIVDVKEMTGLNNEFRGKNNATNVLSFPMNETVDSVYLLGDVVICAQVLDEEAKAAAIEPAAHWAHILTHGLLHLLGYDHQTNEQAEIMENLEIEILDCLGYSSPYC